MSTAGPVALVLCGALARETIAIAARHGWDVQLFGINALHHLRPQLIAPALEQRLRELIPRFGRIIVVYGDCGTGGQLDAVLAHYNVPRIAGPHCYEMYAGPQAEAMQAEQPGTFFLTDFLVRSFDAAVWRGLGLDRYPELRPIYFANYTRLVYLVQRDDPDLIERAAVIARTLELPLELRHTGYGLLERRLVAFMAEIHSAYYQPRLPLVEENLYGDLPDPVLARSTTASTGARRRRARKPATGEPLPGGS